MMGLPLQQMPEPQWPDIWSSVRERVRLEFGQGIFDTWIAPLSLRDVETGHVRLSAPRRLIRDYVTSHHATRLERAFAAQTPAFVSLEIVVAAPELRAVAVAPKPAAMAAKPASPIAPLNAPPFGAAKVSSVSLQGLWDRQPDPAQSFAGFIVGPSNEFAFKAAQRFAETGDSEMGLLFIHGGFGFGKTHLLNAIALEARAARGARVLFLRAEDFMRRFLAALRNQETLAFKEELRGADILLIDDLQHICGRTATISEFLHTVNAFTDLKRKVVIAADRPPSTLEGLSEDIRSRLQGAVVIALEKPDTATRLAILRAKAAEMERKRPRQVAMYLARELTSRSLPDIGRRFGGRDHTTVLHACRRIEALCKTDPVFQQEVDFLRKVLGRPPRAIS
jgi:chromosomal replication initiator protein